MLTTQPNKEFYLQQVSLFGCVVSICSACCKIDDVVFLFCRCFFYLQRVELSHPPYLKTYKCVHHKYSQFGLML